MSHDQISNIQSAASSVALDHMQATSTQCCCSNQPPVPSEHIGCTQLTHNEAASWLLSMLEGKGWATARVGTVHVT
jgi:hypothetical protein